MKGRQGGAKERSLNAGGGGQAEPQTEPASDGAADVGASDDGAERKPRAELVPTGDRFPANLFLIALPGAVVFPDLPQPLLLREPWADRTVLQAQSQSEFVGVAVCEKADGSGDRPPDPRHLAPFGCLVRIMRSLQMPDGSRTLLVHGLRRFRIERLLRRKPYLIAKVGYPDEVVPKDDESEAMARSVRNLMRQVIQETPGSNEEIGIAVLNIERKGALADFAATYFVKNFELKCELLGELDIKVRLKKVLEELTRELHILNLGNRIQEEIREKLEKRQREFFLREQMKAIRRELGEERDERTLEVEDFQKKMESLLLPEVVRDRVKEDLRRLAMISMESPEAGVLRTYLDWVLGLPWGKVSRDQLSLPLARRMLDRDHYGLTEIKKRIVEFLAVRQKVPAHKGPILCFTGPPGVGKTSLGRSIAEALGRKFIRISLGGMHDEAEIRGHRRTYIGSQPGRIIRGLRTAGSINPVFMLDELDKIGQDFRGDPSAALLEVLDPQLNHQFSDHYLEVPVDLSGIFFIGTANVLDTVPPALRDRLEVIEMSGYITEEKLRIGSRFLLPRQLENHGLRKRDLKVSGKALRRIIDEYTREAGVRHLEQALARICRKVATDLVEGRRRTVVIVPGNLQRYLGVPRFTTENWSKGSRVGLALGMAWTPVGGEVLEVQVMKLPQARTPLEITGMLGEVMNESARIAISYVYSHARELGITDLPGARAGLHVHVPAGAVRKDGPSAGVTIATAVVSLLLNEPVRRGIAMSGELTLSGQVLMVGGIRDKLLAARRYGISRVILPLGNRREVEEIPSHLLKGMRVHYVEQFADLIAEVLPTSTRHAVEPLPLRAKPTKRRK